MKKYGLLLLLLLLFIGYAFYTNRPKKSLVNGGPIQPPTPPTPVMTINGQPVYNGQTLQNQLPGIGISIAGS